MQYKLSKSDWEEIGTKMGWLKEAKKHDSLSDCLKDCPDMDPDARQECKDDCARMFKKADSGDSGKEPEVGKQTGKIKEKDGNEIIRILCPNEECRRVLAVPAKARGKLVRCRGCGKTLRIPEKR